MILKLNAENRKRWQCILCFSTRYIIIIKLKDYSVCVVNLGKKYISDVSLNRFHFTYPWNNLCSNYFCRCVFFKRTVISV